MRVIKPGHGDLIGSLIRVMWLTVQAVLWAIAAQLWMLGCGVRRLYQWWCVRE